MGNDRKGGCGSGCLKFLVIGFVILMIFGFIGRWTAEKEWRKERPQVLASIGRAVDAGDYDSALSQAEPYRVKGDPEINGLVSKAENLKEQALEKVRQQRQLEKQAKVAELVAKIRGGDGEERVRMLRELLSLDPLTKEFPEELSPIREEEKQWRKEALAKQEAELQAEAERRELTRKEAAEREEKAEQERARLALEAQMAEFKWRYETSKDELTSKPVYLAGVRSINRVNFDFPYQGEQRGQLMLRTHPQYGKDVILSVQKGQMLVRSYEDTTVKVVFDAGDAVSYSVAGPSDHGTTSLYFRDYRGFVAKMMKAKKVKVSVPFYQQGNVVFEFNVGDFDSDKYLGGK